jgi:hypothetical protein
VQEASERVRIAREAKLAAAALLTRADAELVAEEAAKAALISDLNSLILQSTVQQYKALESLENRIDGLAARVGAPEAAAPPDGVAVTLATASSPRAQPGAAAVGPAGDGAGGEKDERAAAVNVARAEMEAAAAVAAAEARSRHVARPKARLDGDKLSLGTKSLGTGVAAAAAPAAAVNSSTGFSGFAV